MVELDIKKYANKLVSKVDQAKFLKHAVIENGDWEPQPNYCHHNVSLWCQLRPEYIPVRGWLYFDLPGLNFVKFVAHSAVKAPDGEFYDITPSETKDYPFIDSELSEEEYAELVESRGFGKIVFPKT